MRSFNRLVEIDTRNNNKVYSFSSTKTFKQELYVSNEAIRRTFDFAYKMAPELHREYRTGGGHIRKPNEIFVNTFTGKLSEFALYEYLSKYDIVTGVPDIEIYPRNEWDTEDLVVTLDTRKTYQLNVKSTKHFGHLMLLEEGDYDRNGVYTPDGSKSDLYVLVRLQFDLERKLKSIKSLYSDKLMGEKKLQQLINDAIQEVKLTETTKSRRNTKIFYDIPGYISHDDLVHIINNNFLIQKGDYLRNTEMDASNFYIQSGDFRPLKDIKKFH